jgi:hypothetical protein
MDGVSRVVSLERVLQDEAVQIDRRAEIERPRDVVPG